MITWRNTGPRDRTRRRPNTASRPATGATWLTWRNVQPVLLRSGGVVGLAGVIISLVSSTFWMVEPSASSGQPPQATAREAAVQPAAATAKPIAAAATPVDAGKAAPRGGSAKLDLVSLPARVSAKAGSPAPVKTAPPPNAPEPPLKQTASPAAPPIQTAAAEAEPQDANFAWKADAVDCPRDWLGSGTAIPKPDGAKCAPMPELAPTEDEKAASPKQPVTTTAASKTRDSQPVTRSAEPAPRIPEARPSTPPPVRVASAVQARPPAAQTRATPVRTVAKPFRVNSPPDCGKKHARWHYVDKRRNQKTWFCK